MKNRNISTCVFTGLFLTPLITLGQEGPAVGQIEHIQPIVNLLVAVSIALFIVVLGFSYAIFHVLKQDGTLDRLPLPKINWSWGKFGQSLNAHVPMTEEQGITLDHNYDGIKELDNKLPPWWLAGFYASILFAFVYVWYFHFGTDWSSEGVYAMEMEQATIEKARYLEQMAELVDENSVDLLTDATSLAEGKEIFVSLCVACHAADGGGGIGPNLTDNYWLHGGSIKDIFSTIKYGVPEKGMISWQDQINPKEIHQVASYIKTLVGTTPANPKDPQGELDTGDVVAADSTLSLSMR